MWTTEQRGIQSLRTGEGVKRRLRLVGSVAPVLLALAIPVHAQPQGIPRTDNRRCLNCHGQPHIAELSPRDRLMMVARPPDQEPLARPPVETPEVHDAEAVPVRPGLYLGSEALVKSVHAKLTCVDCHVNAGELPHPPSLGPARCSTQCHPKAYAGHLQGAHAEALARGNPLAPTCATCHGGHDILPVHDRESITFSLNVVRVCGNCHEKHRDATPNGHDPKEYMQSYLGSVHGKAVTEGGLVVAATCVDCHGHHEVRPADDTRSLVNRGQIPQTCGQCHLGIMETYADSVHGQRLAEGDESAPVCSDCHTAHGITHARTPEFMLDIVRECGGCHDQVRPGQGRRASFYDTYRQSYHGQVTGLGSTRAARCSDCHGAHDIRPIADPNSRLHLDHRVSVCAKCHQGATARLARFEPHADYRDADRYPLLHAVWLYFIIIMSCSFGFFGLHSVLWFFRSVIERVKNGPHPRYAGNPTAIHRFTKTDRMNHLVTVISFFGLTLTGLPLRFSDHDWARELAGFLGGGNVAGILHRIFAVVLCANFVAHAVSVKRYRNRYESFRGWLFGPNSLMPRKQDFKDCLGMFRWFFRGGAKPSFDHWTYWEKFDYAAEVIGSLIIGGSGLLLWFPVFFSSFLPGWIFNVAIIIHGYEALLAVGFIFSIHFFNTHLRMEKFPVDDVIFTGRVPEEEFKHERGAEYARLVATGEIASLRVPGAPRWQRHVAIAVGALAVSIGMSLVALIILAGLGVI